MSKIKTPKAIAKRFKVSPTGKVIGVRSFGRHLKLNKSKNRLRRINTPKIMTGTNAKKIKKALGAA